MRQENPTDRNFFTKNGMAPCRCGDPHYVHQVPMTRGQQIVCRGAGSLRKVRLPKLQGARNRGPSMKTYIKLTPSYNGTFNGVWIDADSIELIEQYSIIDGKPVTHLTLAGGDYTQVKETPEEILNLFQESVGLRPQSGESKQVGSLDVDLLRDIKSLIDTLAVRLGLQMWPQSAASIRVGYQGVDPGDRGHEVNLDDHSTCEYRWLKTTPTLTEQQCKHGKAIPPGEPVYLAYYVEELISIVREVVRVSDDIVGLVRPYFKESEAQSGESETP